MWWINRFLLVLIPLVGLSCSGLGSGAEGSSSAGGGGEVEVAEDQYDEPEDQYDEPEDQEDEPEDQEEGAASPIVRNVPLDGSASPRDGFVLFVDEDVSGECEIVPLSDRAEATVTIDPETEDPTSLTINVNPRGKMGIVQATVFREHPGPPDRDGPVTVQARARTDPSSGPSDLRSVVEVKYSDVLLIDGNVKAREFTARLGLDRQLQIWVPEDFDTDGGGENGEPDGWLGVGEPVDLPTLEGPWVTVRFLAAIERYQGMASIIVESPEGDRLFEVDDIDIDGIPAAVLDKPDWTESRTLSFEASNLWTRDYGSCVNREGKTAQLTYDLVSSGTSPRIGDLVSLDSG